MGLMWKPLVAAILVVACSPKPEPKAATRETIRFVYAPSPEPEVEFKYQTTDVGTFDCGTVKLNVYYFPVDYPHRMTGVNFLAADANVARPSLMWDGSFKSLCARGRFLLVSDNVHFAVGPSFVMDARGAVVSTLSLGWGPSVGVSDDNKVFWAQTHEGDGIKETRLRAFDLDGNELLDRRFVENGQVVDVTFDGQPYRIQVADPTFPG